MIGEARFRRNDASASQLLSCGWVARIVAVAAQPCLKCQLRGIDTLDKFLRCLVDLPVERSLRRCVSEKSPKVGHLNDVLAGFGGGATDPAEHAL